MSNDTGHSQWCEAFGNRFLPANTRHTLRNRGGPKDGDFDLRPLDSQRDVDERGCRALRDEGWRERE